MQQRYICSKNQNYLLEKFDLGYFSQLRVEDHNKNHNIQNFLSYNYNISSCYRCAKNIYSFNKTLHKTNATEVATYIMVKKKQKSFCEIAI